MTQVIQCFLQQVLQHGYFMFNFKYLLRLKIITHTNAKRTDSNWSLINAKKKKKIIKLIEQKSLLKFTHFIDF